VAAALMIATMGLGSCSSGERSPGRLKIVASFYPLAWAAKQLAPEADIKDLTPRGGEPHDLQLNASQRLAVQEADLVLLLPKGFQPEVERAARDARGAVVDFPGIFNVVPTRKGGVVDPHVWLDPIAMAMIEEIIVGALQKADGENAETYRSRMPRIGAALQVLDEEFRKGLARCTLRTIVTTHEAFEYLAKRYGLTQLALTGLTPEAEPSAAQIQRVRDAARRGEVGAIFYEATDEGKRIGRSLASDVGVPALPLNTLESDPAPGDYLSQMRDNLVSLEKGLRCR
jgi:zinc transport system substrate-binding protein